MPTAVILLLSNEKLLRQLNNIIEEAITYFKDIVEIMVKCTDISEEDIKTLISKGVRKIVVLPIKRKTTRSTFSMKKYKLIDGKVKVIYAKPILSSEVTAENIISEIQRLLKP